MGVLCLNPAALHRDTDGAVHYWLWLSLVECPAVGSDLVKGLSCSSQSCNATARYCETLDVDCMEGSRSAYRKLSAPRTQQV
jgi:hypothetical protein